MHSTAGVTEAEKAVPCLSRRLAGPGLRVTIAGLWPRVTVCPGSADVTVGDGLT